MGSHWLAVTGPEGWASMAAWICRCDPQAQAETPLGLGSEASAAGGLLSYMYDMYGLRPVKYVGPEWRLSSSTGTVLE